MMNRQIPPLLILLLLVQTACKQEEIAEPEAPPAFHFENVDSVAFADFLKAAALVSQRVPVAFHHPDLPAPIHFTSRQADCTDPVDPMVLQLLGDQILYDSEPLDEAALQKWTQRVIRQFELVDEPPLLGLIASEKPAVSFENGLAVLRIFVDNGIKQVIIARPISLEERSARIEKKPAIKPGSPPPPAR